MRDRAAAAAATAAAAGSYDSVGECGCELERTFFRFVTKDSTLTISVRHGPFGTGAIFNPRALF